MTHAWTEDDDGTEDGKDGRTDGWTTTATKGHDGTDGHRTDDYDGTDSGTD